MGKKKMRLCITFEFNLLKQNNPLFPDKEKKEHPSLQQIIVPNDWK